MLLKHAEGIAAPEARALLCRFGLASAAAAAAAAGGKAGGADGNGSSDGGEGGALSAAMRKALSGLAALSQRLLSSSSICAAAEEAAAAAATAAAAPPLHAVHAFRAALCLAGCQGAVLQLSEAKAIAGGGAGAAGAGHAGGAAAAATTTMTTTSKAAAAAAGMSLDGSFLSGVLLCASRWVATERRLYDSLVVTSPLGMSSNSGGGSGAATTADTAVVTEPLEHCATLMYGMAKCLPVLGQGRRVSGRGGGGAADGVAAESDDTLQLLVAVLQALLACTAPSERFCYSRTSNMWGALLADVEPEGAARASRRLLLECFRFMLSRSHRGQLATLLRRLLTCLRQEGGVPLPSAGLTSYGQPAIHPPLQCLLVALECLSGPRVAKLLSAQGPAATAALTELLAGAAARATAAAGGGGGGGGGGNAAALRGVAAVAAGGSRLHQRAAAEAALCCALRCLQSVAGREVTFRMAPPAVTGVLSAVFSIASCPQLRPQRGGGIAMLCGGGDGDTLASGGGCGAVAGSDLYFLHAACCALVATVVRHHEGVVRHCTALVVSTCRELLLRLATWASELRIAQRQLQLRAPPPTAASAAVAAAADGIEHCAAALARVYEAVSEHPKTLGKYAPHMIADYIVHVATPLPSLALLMHADDGDLWATDPRFAAPEVDAAAAAATGSSAGVGATLLPQPAHDALRRGAFSLMGCLGPPQLQHLHMAMGAAGDAAVAATGGGGAGAARRGALAQLRKEYDSSYKYTGKV